MEAYMTAEEVKDGVIYNTALAQEIKSKFPLTVSMSGRKYVHSYFGKNRKRDLGFPVL